MRIFESEQILGLFFLELTKMGVRKVTEDEIYDFNFKFLVEIGKVSEDSVACRIDKRDIISFTDKFSNFFNYSFNLRRITVRHENTSIMFKSFIDRYVKSFLKEDKELEESDKYDFDMVAVHQNNITALHEKFHENYLKEKGDKQKEMIELIKVIDVAINEMIAKFCREAVIFNRQAAIEILSYIQRKTCTFNELEQMDGCIYDSRETTWQKRLPYLKEYKLVKLAAMNYIEFEPRTRCEIDASTLLKFYNNPETAEEFAYNYSKTPLLC